MVKTQNIDTALLNKAIEDSGKRVGFLVDALGLSRQAFDRKRKGLTSFRLSEVYVLCDLLDIKDEQTKNAIFFPEKVCI